MRELIFTYEAFFPSKKNSFLSHVCLRTRTMAFHYAYPDCGPVTQLVCDLLTVSRGDFSLPPYPGSGYKAAYNYFIFLHAIKCAMTRDSP